MWLASLTSAYRQMCNYDEIYTHTGCMAESLIILIEAHAMATLYPRPEITFSANVPFRFVWLIHLYLNPFIFILYNICIVYAMPIILA